MSTSKKYRVGKVTLTIALLTGTALSALASLQVYAKDRDYCGFSNKASQLAAGSCSQPTLTDNGVRGPVHAVDPKYAKKTNQLSDAASISLEVGEKLAPSGTTLKLSKKELTDLIQRAMDGDKEASLRLKKIGIVLPPQEPTRTVVETPVTKPTLSIDQQSMPHTNGKKDSKNGGAVDTPPTRTAVDTPATMPTLNIDQQSMPHTNGKKDTKKTGTVDTPPIIPNVAEQMNEVTTTAGAAMTPGMSTQSDVSTSSSTSTAIDVTPSESVQLDSTSSTSMTVIVTPSTSTGPGAGPSLQSSLSVPTTTETLSTNSTTEISASGKQSAPEAPAPVERRGSTDGNTKERRSTVESSSSVGEAAFVN